MNIGIILIIIQVILLDGILSIDNAAALAAIAEELPKKAYTPHVVKFLGKYQRVAALRVGILGAYIGRGLMLVLAGFILMFPLLRLLGAAYLLYLVGKHFFGWKGFDPEFKGVNNFWKAVITIELADLAFSLDNVAAVVAITPNIILVLVGVFISIIIMRFAAQLFMKLIEFEPLLEHSAFLLIFAIAVEMILRFFSIEVSPVLQFLISLNIILLGVTYGHLARKG